MAMQLTHEFTVPATVDETWTALNDIESVAQCFPGATVASADENGFEGSVKVKLGPIALVYNGSGTFVEKDETAHRMTIEAKGKDKRGNGTAGADVVATLNEDPDGTRVRVETELSITGKPAQFGRGMIQDVSDKLLDQFVDCLKTKLGPAAAASVEDAEHTEEIPQPTAATSSASTATSSSASAGQEDEPLDLGSTLLPALVKAYGKPLAIGAGVVILFLLWRRLRRD
ncbi:SRPBCC family protein [Aeromicrobium sp. YIM 150415]|uniref:SRPBCC family protein n=1 Tax=Aeromicrobium sp. YIM 150415 TaxID=2803912 RepID=UPI001F064CD8|nr:SRPBCC family protein [Aeromicrobium sp. YIM 150415]